MSNDNETATETENTKIQLSREQQLEFENIQLRISAVQNEMQQLLARRGGLLDAIAKEHDVDLKGWIVNINDGIICSPQSPAVPATA